MRHRRPALATLGLATSLAIVAPACLLASTAYESANGSTSGDTTTGLPSTSSGIAGDGGGGGDSAVTGSGGDPSSSSSSTTTSTANGGTAGTGGTGGSGGGDPVLGDACPGIPTSIALYSELLIDNGDTTLAANDTGASCGGGSSPDVVYAVTVQGKGYLSVKLEADPSFNGIVYIRTSCKQTNTQLGCGNSPAPVLVEKDTVAYVWVDGAEGSSGKFKLRLYLDGCGNGTIEKEHEECDDGNILFADGCDTTCNVECGCPTGVNDCATFEDPTTHHCYALVKGSDATWANAKTSCETWSGATLAVLATQAEIDSVKPSLSSGSNEIWIGGSDFIQEGTFNWVNGELWTYVNGSNPWHKGGAGGDEPNNYNGNEDCAEIAKSNGELNDEECSDSQDFLCERSPAGEQVGVVEP